MCWAVVHDESREARPLSLNVWGRRHGVLTGAAGLVSAERPVPGRQSRHSARGRRVVLCRAQDVRRDARCFSDRGFASCRLRDSLRTGAYCRRAREMEVALRACGRGPKAARRCSSHSVRIQPDLHDPVETFVDHRVFAAPADYVWRSSRPTTRRSATPKSAPRPRRLTHHRVTFKLRGRATGRISLRSGERHRRLGEKRFKLRRHGGTSASACAGLASRRSGSASASEGRAPRRRAPAARGDGARVSRRAAGSRPASPRPIQPGRGARRRAP